MQKIVKSSEKSNIFLTQKLHLNWQNLNSIKGKKYIKFIWPTVISLQITELIDIFGCMQWKKSKFKFNCFRRNVYQSHKELELSAESQEEAETWKASFLRAGVFPEKNKEEKTESVSYYVKSNWVAVFYHFLFSLSYHFLWIKCYLFVDQRRYRISRSPTRETDWNNQEFGWFISQNHPQESQRHGS